MSGHKLFLDTNIVLYLLGGDHVLATILDQKEIFISVITEMELLAYPNISMAETQRIAHFLSDCQIIELRPDIKEIAIEMRKNHQLKLPDAIVAASAKLMDVPLISADKIFQRVANINFILYQI